MDEIYFDMAEYMYNNRMTIEKVQNGAYYIVVSRDNRSDEEISMLLRQTKVKMMMLYRAQGVSVCDVVVRYRIVTPECYEDITENIVAMMLAQYYDAKER